MRFLCVLLLAAGAAALNSPLGVQFPKKTLMPTSRSAGDALYLTPYIKSGQLEKARELSKVEHLPGFDGESYSGYFTVNEQYNSNMFFWFFPAKNYASEAPVTLWLQGGPGGSSMFGLFVETGPFGVDNNLKLYPRNITWTETLNVLYIDNPVGTGFSFTEDDAGYATNEEDVGRDLYSALTQFFTVFSSFQKNDFYVTGESYAGKYVPAAAYTIHLNNPSAQLKINLKGVAIGDGLVDPVNQLDYGDLLYGIGLIDAEERDYFVAQGKKTADLIKQGKFVEAFNAWDKILNGDTSPYPTYYYNCTGFNNYYNYLFPENPYNDPFDAFLNQEAVRKAIHVGSRPFNDGQTVEDHLIPDMMNSSKPMVTALLDADYRVLIYNGQLDIIIGYTLTEQWLSTVEWKGAAKYRQAERQIWSVQNQLAGYVRQADNLNEVMVRNSGHILPADQPAWGFALINTFTAKGGPMWR